MNALAGLMNPGQMGQGIVQAFQGGMEQAREREARNALAAYAQNPSAESAAAVAQHDPRTGIQLGQMEQQRQAQEAEQARLAREQAMQGVQQFRPLIEHAMRGPEQWQAVRMAAMQGGQDVSNVPEQYDPDWARGQLMLMEAVEQGIDLTPLARDVMLSLRPEHRNVDDPMFIAAMGRAREKQIPVQAGGRVVGVNTVTGDARDIVAPGNGPQAPVPYDENEWEVVEEGTTGNSGGGF